MSNNTEWNHRFNEAVELYHKGVKGNKKASQQAYKLFEALTSEKPNHVELLGYYGSATALLARDTPIPKDKKKYALEGLKMLDQAISKEPNNYTLRILRGNVCARMPESVFHRTSTAIEDFEMLVDAYKHDSTVISENTYQSILNELEKGKKRIKY
jgi:predicted ATPase